MRILLGVAGVAAVGISGAASAADLPARTYTKAPAYVAATVYDWSGFYIGANGGWGGTNNFWTLQTAAGNFPEGSTDASGGTVGGQVGYRWQTGPAVFGVEAQGNWAHLAAGIPPSPPPMPASTTAAISMRSACSPARSAMPGTMCCFMPKAARRSPTRVIPI